MLQSITEGLGLKEGIDEAVSATGLTSISDSLIGLPSSVYWNRQSRARFQKFLIHYLAGMESAATVPESP